MKSICVFAGSKMGDNRLYEDAARDLGRAIAARGQTLIYGGGSVGLMAVTAEAAMAGGGRVIGVIPGALAQREVAHENLAELRVVRTMHERKALMSELSDAVIALPGGLGTMDELFEMLTWAQLGIHAKPCGLLNVSGYYDTLLALLDHMVAENFLDPVHRSMLLVDDDAERLLDAMPKHKLPGVEKWLDYDVI
jgi:uncharacterized protein (TIGR00730 family)